MTLKKKQFLRKSSVWLAVAVAVLVPVSPSFAASPPSSIVSKGAMTPLTSTGVGSKGAAPLTSTGLAITCSIKVNYPHASHHVPGMANVTATLSCTAPVYSLAMTVTIVPPDGNSVSKPYSNMLSSSLGGNAATTCTSDYYSASAVGTVEFPIGFNPPGGTVAAYSPTLYVSC